MGLPMARNVLNAGFPLLAWNRTHDRSRPLVDAGAEAVDTPVDLAAADVVITMVSDSEAAQAILVASGLMDRLRPGSTVIEMSTIGPAAVAELAAEAKQRGIALLDAPVSGSVSVAEAAQLFAMVGGDEAAYRRVAPVLDAMTKGHILLGPSGSGAAMKLAVNAMIAATNESLAETLALAEGFGIDQELAYDVVENGALASPFVQYKRRAFIEPDATPAAFTTALMRKDIVLALALANEVGVRLPVAAAAGDVLREAVDKGLADEDMAAVLRVLRPGSPAETRPSNVMEEP